MKMEYLRKKVNEAACLPNDEWLKIGEEAKKLDKKEFALFRDTPEGVVLGERLQLIKDMNN